MAIVKISLVLLTVLVTLSTAILLNYGAKENDIFSIGAGIIIFLVLSINFIKFKIWGIIYKRYHLSESYPLVSLFFPLIYIVAIYNGEAILELNKILGIFFILFGIYVMNSKKEII
jgi:hypothetical protein